MQSPETQVSTQVTSGNYDLQNSQRNETKSYFCCYCVKAVIDIASYIVSAISNVCSEIARCIKQCCPCCYLLPRQGSTGSESVSLRRESVTTISTDSQSEETESESEGADLQDDEGEIDLTGLERPDGMAETTADDSVSESGLGQEPETAVAEEPQTPDDDEEPVASGSSIPPDLAPPLEPEPEEDILSASGLEEPSLSRRTSLSLGSSETIYTREDDASAEGAGEMAAVAIGPDDEAPCILHFVGSSADVPNYAGIEHFLRNNSDLACNFPQGKWHEVDFEEADIKIRSAGHKEAITGWLGRVKVPATQKLIARDSILKTIGADLFGRSGKNLFSITRCRDSFGYQVLSRHNPPKMIVCHFCLPDMSLAFYGAMPDTIPRGRHVDLLNRIFSEQSYNTLREKLKIVPDIRGITLKIPLLQTKAYNKKPALMCNIATDTLQFFSGHNFLEICINPVNVPGGGTMLEQCKRFSHMMTFNIAIAIQTEESQNCAEPILFTLNINNCRVPSKGQMPRLH